MIRTTSFVTLLCLLAAGPSLAGDEEEPNAEPRPTPSGFLAEFLALDQTYSGKVVALAKAIPQEHYGWRPSAGVRSISEALMHVAATNFGAAQAVGATLPEGLPPDLAKISDKEEVVRYLESAFALVQEAALSLAGVDLSQPAGGGPVTMRAAILAHAEHHGEHLGQLIAYARSVGVVPPWSQLQ